MPKNYSASVKAIITYIDEVFFGADANEDTDNSEDLNPASHSFELTPLSVRWYLWSWQELQPTISLGASFYRFCDALEVKNSVSMPESGWGVDHALSAWAKWLTPTNSTVDVVAPKPNILHVLSNFQMRFPTILIPNGDSINALYGRWDIKNKRLFFTNGKCDPWGEATVSAVNRTGMSTDDKPIGLLNGIHCTDLVMALIGPDPTIVAVQGLFLDYVVGGFYGQKILGQPNNMPICICFPVPSGV
ncbi:uncharacterized protein ARMOST_19306 [Armillaria ostoyae]|uniref:Uncharacterized protein n=1 Tax=Armillaria ostoyae TaxID=47428 RepID=A0A284S472_ARMOS|nr:uncharacterized protein ARMOST_19306 [Armillaria ostoyae]